MINIPTLQELYDDVLSDLQTNLNITIPIFGKSFLRALSAVQAAKLKLYYLALALVQKNLFVDTADPESRGGTLERFGRVKLGRNPRPARAAVYTVTVTGAAGAIIPASTTFKADDTSLNPGALFVLDSAFTLTAATDTVDIRALTAGLDSRLSIGDTITSTSPLLNVEDETAVSVIATEPLAAEDIEDYRASTIQAFQREPNGGSPSDYRIWADDAAGVRTVYPYAGQPSNSVTVYVEGVTGNGEVTTSILNDVDAVIRQDPDTSKPINDRGRKPIQVILSVVSVTAQSVDITVTGLQTDTPVIRNAISAALSAALNEFRPYIAGAQTLDSKNDILSVGRVGVIVQTALTGGNFFNSVSLTVGGTAIASQYTFQDGNIPELNNVTYA